MEYQPIGEELSARSTFSDANKGARAGYEVIGMFAYKWRPICWVLPADREDVMVVYGPVRDRRKDICPAAAEP